MPWKNETDPYKIWLSEIILQQTRVDQGTDYYNRFIKAFPNVHKLAKARQDKVFKLWEGLGYYSRCRNLIATAKFISSALNGKFPDTYDTIKSLKGVGPYTAAAISSFAFNLPYAVVDGNVYRVLARVFGISTPIDSPEGKRQFTALSNDLLNNKQPGIYNQAIMDFGAVICKPAPACDVCVFNKSCFAFLNNRVNQLPVKEKRITIKNRWIYYLILQINDQTAIRQRTKKDIWQHLYEFPLVESESELEIKTVLKQAEKYGLPRKKDYELVSVSPVFKQQLSHQLIAGQFITIQLKRQSLSKAEPLASNCFWVTKKQMKKYPFAKFINNYLSQRSSQALF